MTLDFVLLNSILDSIGTSPILLGSTSIPWQACEPQGSTILQEVPVDLEPYDVRPVEREWELNRPHTGWTRTFGNGNGNGNSDGAKAKAKATAEVSAATTTAEDCAGDPTGSKTSDCGGGGGGGDTMTGGEATWRRVANGPFPHHVKREREASKIELKNKRRKKAEGEEELPRDDEEEATTEGSPFKSRYFKRSG